MNPELTARISPEHRRRLAWFEEHQGEVSPIPGPLPDGLLLITDSVDEAMTHIRKHSIEQFGLQERRVPSNLLAEE